MQFKLLLQLLVQKTISPMLALINQMAMLIVQTILYLAIILLEKLMLVIFATCASYSCYRQLRSD